MNQTNQSETNFKLEADYGGALIELRYGKKPNANLVINGISRELVSSAESNITLKLSSTVQTDYEWHEFIEAVVVYGPDRIDATLQANSLLIASSSEPRNA